MGATAVRVAACATVLVGGILLGDGAVGMALADPGGGGSGGGDEQSSKDVGGTETGGTAAAGGSSGERQAATQATFGAPVDGAAPTDESKLSTLSEVSSPEPEVATSSDRGSQPEGTAANNGTDVSAPSAPADTGGGSDYAETANNVAVAGQNPAQKKPKALPPFFPFLPGVFLEVRVRRGGGDWWNAERIIERLEAAILPAPPEPTPTLRSKEAPILEAPVLDSSGGDGGGGGSDQITGFDGAPILHAPIVVAPGIAAAGTGVAAGAGPAGAAPGAQAVTRGTASGSPRVAGAETTGGSTNPAIRWSTTPAQSPSTGTLTPLSGQAPRQGYPEFVRTAGLPQLAGAALPGVAGILFLTFGGGLIGYRQASAGRMIRASAAARYLP